MFLWLKTLYRKRAVTWPFIFYTIIWTLSKIYKFQRMKHCTSFTLIMQQTKFGEDKIWDMEMGIIQQEVTKICWID